MPASLVSPRPQPADTEAALDSLLAALLCCPACAARPALELRADTSLEADALLFCAVCGREYPIKNGVPYLLIESAPSDDRDGDAGETI